jgi:hypothetical protein
MENALSRLPNQANLVGVPNQTTNVHLIAKVVTLCLWLFDNGDNAKKIYNFTMTIYSLTVCVTKWDSL